MKIIDDEENMTWPNLKAMLAVVPKEPGTLFIALCCDHKGSTGADFPYDYCVVLYTSSSWFCHQEIFTETIIANFEGESEMNTRILRNWFFTIFVVSL